MPSSVKAIIPPEFDEKALMDQLIRGAKDFGPELAKAHQPTVAGWTGDRPKFTPVVRETKDGITLYIRLDGSEKGRMKWLWINYGTKGPYPITARPGGKLHFNVPYKAGSRPGTVSTKRGKSGSNHRTANQVMHPGIKARSWTELIAKDMEGAYIMAMSNAMAKAAKASGHAMK